MMLVRKLKICFYVLLVVFLQFTDSPSILGQNLSGIWQDNNRASYSFRQLGEELYWRMDTNVTSNVFVGFVSGKTITGEWVDLPGSKDMNNGSMTLEIVTHDYIRKIDQQGSYGAFEWRRVPVFTQPVESVPNEPSENQVSNTSNTDVQKIFSFGKSKYPLGELLPPPMEDKIIDHAYDEAVQGEPKARLTITDIELLEHSNLNVRKCHRPGVLMLTIQNTGNKETATDIPVPVGINGQITTIAYSENKGAYERVNVPLVIGAQREWIRLKAGISPGESRKIFADYGGIEGMVVGRLGHFMVRVNLTEPVLDQKTQAKKYIIYQTMVKEFNVPASDLSLPKGSVYMRQNEENKVALAIRIVNEGNLETPGTVAIRITVPVINPIHINDNWVDFRFDLQQTLKPGEEIAITDFDKIVATCHPKRGKPDWGNALFEVYSNCPYTDLNAFDKDNSNNFFKGKSRVMWIHNNW